MASRYLTPVLLLTLIGCSLGTDLSSQADPNPLRAEAGTDRLVQPGELVVLDARGSTGPPGQSFRWTQLAGAPVELGDESMPSFVAPTGAQTLIFELEVSAGAHVDTDTVSVTVANSAPQAHAGEDLGVEGGAEVQLDGSASSDPDGDELRYQWEQVSGPALRIGEADANTASIQPPAERADYVFALTVRDGDGAEDIDDVTVSVGNQVPVAVVNADVAVESGGVATLDASASHDPDGDAITFQWTQVDGAASPLDDPSSATPMLRAPTTRQMLVYEVRVHDGSVESAPALVRVQIANADPVVSISGPEVAEPGARVVLDASDSSDPDGDELRFTWSVVDGDVELSQTQDSTVEFNAPDHRAQVTIGVTVEDGEGGAARSQLSLNVDNSPPRVFAGEDVQVHAGATVELQGAATDPDEDELVVGWTQTAGPPVRMDSDGARVTFAAPIAVGEITLLFQATDGVASASDDIVIHVANEPPTADAGDDAVADRRTRVTLDGSASADPDGDELSYAWEQVTGTPVRLDAAGTARPTFMAPFQSPPMTFALRVSDGIADSEVDTVTIALVNRPPIAEAGSDQLVEPAGMFTLTGAGSTDPDEDDLSYTWAQLEGDPAMLLAQTPPQAVFEAPRPRQTLVFELTVEDGQGATATDTVSIHTGNNAPVAEPGEPQAVPQGSRVTLDGRGSADIDGDELVYVWRQLGGPPVQIYEANTATPELDAPLARAVLRFGLTVSDGQSSSTEAVTTVTVLNSPPIVNAGPDQLEVDGGAEVTLDGRDSSDQDEDPLTFLWVQIEGQPVELDDPSSDRPKFHAGHPRQAYVFELRVSDGMDDGIPDRVRITTANNAPIALAGDDRHAQPGSRVVVVGSGLDIDGDDLEYSWVQHSGPDVSLARAETPSVSFIMPGQEIELDLTVTDPFGASHRDRVKIREQP